MFVWTQRRAALALVGACLLGCGDESVKPVTPEPVTPEPSAPALAVDFLAPQEGAATRDSLGIALDVRGGLPDRVDLYVDERWMARLDAASYRWDTRDWPEGEHTLTARVTLGSQVITSPGRKVVLDRSPPRLVTRQPEPGSNTAAAGGFIFLNFSEPLVPSVLESVRLQVRAPGQGPLSLAPRSLSEDRKTLIFRSTALAPAPYAPSAVLSGQLEDDLGNRGSVAAEPWSWTVDSLAPLGNVLTGVPAEAQLNKDASAPALRVDSLGRPVIAWRMSAGNIVVRRWEGSAWVTRSSDAVPEDGGVFSGLVLDGEGRPLVLHRHAASTALWRREAGGWSRWSTLGPNPQGEFTRLGAAVLARGTTDSVRVAWVAESKTTPGTAGVMLYWQKPGSDDGFFYPFSPGTALLDRPLGLTTSASGAALLTWSDRTGAGAQTRIRWVSASGDSSDVSPVSGDLPSTPPELALGPLDEPFMSWVGSGSIQVRRWTGGAWSALGSGIETSSGVDPSQLRHTLGVDGAGRPLVVWSLTGRVEVSRWDGERWSRLTGSLTGATEGPTPWPVVLWPESANSALVGHVNPDASARGRVSLFRLND